MLQRGNFALSAYGYNVRNPMEAHSTCLLSISALTVYQQGRNSIDDSTNSYLFNDEKQHVGGIRGVNS